MVHDRVNRCGGGHVVGGLNDFREGDRSAGFVRCPGNVMIGEERAVSMGMVQPFTGWYLTDLGCGELPLMVVMWRVRLNFGQAAIGW